MTALSSVYWRDLDAGERQRCLSRPAWSLDERAMADVRRIVAIVRRDGDRGVRQLTQRFDGIDASPRQISPDALPAARAALGSAEYQALRHAQRNITRFHQAQRCPSVALTVEAGVTCRQERRAIDAVGLYVPGGSAPLPSAVLMLAIPAAIAGCRRRVICTPPQSDGRVAPAVLAAAALCGVTEVHAVGGAQAIAALAYGCESIAPVDKIFGPGNAYVTAAKMIVSLDPAGAACDLPAGPTEVLVIADDSAEAEAVAADLLAQAEHGPDSQVLLFTDSAALATRVGSAVAMQIEQRTRADIIRSALGHSVSVVFESIDEAIAASNCYAPEHLIINTRDARERVAAVQSAGSVFVGPWAAEVFGDYCSGANHVLPTYGFARAGSGLGVADFEKTITVQEVSQQGFDRLADTAATLALTEGLDAHAAAVEVRRRLNVRRGVA